MQAIFPALSRRLAPLATRGPAPVSIQLPDAREEVRPGWDWLHDFTQPIWRELRKHDPKIMLLGR